MNILSFFSKLFRKCDCNEKIADLTTRIEKIEEIILTKEEEKEPIFKDVEFFHGKIVITEEIFENGLVLFNDTDEETGLYSINFYDYIGDNQFVCHDEFNQLYHIQIPAHSSYEFAPYTSSEHWNVGEHFDFNIDYGTITRYAVIG